MARNISFSLTTQQIRNRTKTVTRRMGWMFLKRGEILNACVKCQGLKKGEKVERICQIRVVSVSREALFCITPREVEKEGFPDWTSDQFIEMFCKANHCSQYQIITRIEFEYLEDAL